MATRLKLEQCILESWKEIKKQLKMYHSSIAEKMNLISLFVSHLTSLKNAESFQFQETAIFNSVKPELISVINSEITSTKSSLEIFLNELDAINSNISKELNKIFSNYRNGVVNKDLGLTEIIFSSSTSCSIAEKIDALNTFKAKFLNFHLSKMHFIEHCEMREDYKKCVDLWNSSNLISAEKDLDVILSS